MTPIGSFATEEHLPLIEPENIHCPKIVSRIKLLEAEAMVVIAFGQKLSEACIGIAPTINLHGSLLPRWRGAAPIHAAIMHGDELSGVSVITLAQQMDAGTILGQVSTSIGECETAGELHDRLALLGPDIVIEVLAGDFSGEIQDDSAVTYAPKLSRKDAHLDLSQNAQRVARKIRGLSPWPGCHLNISGVDCKIINAIPKDSSGAVGEILSDGTIAVGEGSIEILELQPAGSTTMSWKDFCNGRSVQAGDMCGVHS
jgi:methionyl-tRNA formyltransferase